LSSLVEELSLSEKDSLLLDSGHAVDFHGLTAGFRQANMHYDFFLIGVSRPIPITIQGMGKTWNSFLFPILLAIT
jgi:hypothetical protein